MDLQDLFSTSWKIDVVMDGYGWLRIWHTPPYQPTLTRRQTLKSDNLQEKILVYTK